MNSGIWVHKLDENGEEVWKYPAEMIEVGPSYIQLKASFDRDDIHVGPLLLVRNDTFIETFYFDHWYNIFEVYGPRGELFKGWYCNITRPAWMEGNQLYAEDLALDLVVMPDGQFEILDQEEFEALNITSDDRQQALQTLDALKKQASELSGIFADRSHS